MMKKLLILCSALLLMESCLKEELRSSTTAETYYRSAAQIETGLNGCYNPLRSIVATRGFWLTTDVDTDVMTISKASGMYEANCDISPARPGVASTIWSNCYIGVMRCNDIIAATNDAVKKEYITEKESEPLMGEAVVLRSLFYYLLTSTFGDVPYYTEKVTEENRSRIAQLPRMSATATRDSCIRDIKYWILGKESLPMRRTYDEGYRAGAALGLMLGAKCALWNEKWPEAITFIEAMEDIYGHYTDTPERFGTDYPLTDIPFTKKYIRESIFECGNSVQEYGLQVSGVIASISTPVRKEAPSAGNAGEEGDADEVDEAEEGTERQSDYYDGIAIPGLGAFARTSTAVRPTAYFYQQLQPYASNDIRGGEYSNGATEPRGGSGNIAWRWKGYDLVNDPDRTEEKVLYFFFGGTKAGSFNSKPWLGNKFWCPGMYNTRDSNNYRLFRFADAILMKAEAYLNMGLYANACAALNVTRVRAGLNPISYAGVHSNEEALMEEIRRERARELFGEFQRKYDLVRWGIWYERTTAYNENEFLKDYIRPCHEYWPIPADQVSYSGNALDNDAYAY